MSICRFRFQVGPSADRLVPLIRAHVERAGGTFADGAFLFPTPVGEFRGDYLLEESAIVIEVTAKPIYVPCSAIESRLADYMKEAG